MFYLVIKNMGVEQCISRSPDNRYKDGQKYDCSQSLEYKKTVEIGKILIKCRVPGGPLIDVEAAIYSD